MSRFLNTSPLHGFHLFKMLIPITMMAMLPKIAAVLDTENTVHINFPRIYNESGITLRYLPVSAARDEESSRYYRRASHLQMVHNQKIHPSSSESPLSVDDASWLQDNAITIEELSCRNYGEEVFFRASVKSAKTIETPIIDEAAKENCKVMRMKDEYRIDLSREKFWRCGVVDCSTETATSFCLSLRFPAISGLRLKGDSKITLRCKVQEKTVSHTKQLTVKAIDTTARVLPRIVSGGFQNHLQSDVGLFRKTAGSENVFDSRIPSGGSVVLGEEILLRALVRDGDGWRYSRISDLMIHYVEKKQHKKIMHSLWLLDSDGCLNPDVREICSREQYRISPLESYLIFQAFMFENMKENDEMVLSVKVSGCQEGADCALNCPAGHNRKSRVIRSIKTTQRDNDTINWQDDIAFKVVFPKESPMNFNDLQMAIPYAFIGFALVIMAMLLSIIVGISKGRLIRH